MKIRSFFANTRRVLLILALAGVLSAILVGTMMPNEWTNRFRAGFETGIQAVVPDFLCARGLNGMMVAHFLIFGLFGLLLSALLPRSPAYWVLVGALAIAGGTELIQILIDGRSARMDDFFINAAGVTAGIGFSKLRKHQS